VSDEYDPDEEGGADATATHANANNNNNNNSNSNDDDDDDVKDGATLGEGWVGVSRPAAKVAPPVPDRAGRQKLYTTVAVKAIDTSVFSEVVRSDRVWWTPDDEPSGGDGDEAPFDVDISDNDITRKYALTGEVTRRADFFVIKSASDKQSGALVSIKAIDAGVAQMLGQSLDALAREVDLFHLCKDAHVCAAFDVVRADASLCLALESIAGAPLNVQLARGHENYTELDARRLVLQCASAVAAVHKAGVAHRDIVPDNFVFTSKTDIASVKLCDFSFAVRLASPSATVPTSPGGDREFQAPEIWADKPHGMPVDIWSLGCLAHLLIAGDTPVRAIVGAPAAQASQHFANIHSAVGAKHACWPANASKSAEAFVRALLQPEAAQRPAAAAVLTQAWLTSKDDAQFGAFKKHLKQWNETR
jgi:serine/threonine protein kinase